MGIHNLNKFLRKNCPHVFEEIHISEYAFKKVAIDTSLFLCKFKAICGDRWLSAFVNLVASLRRNEIHCVFIYDTGAPPEKTIERARRVEQREKTDKRVYELETALEEYYKTGVVSDLLLDLYIKIKDKTPEQKVQTRLLSAPKENKLCFDVKLVQQKIKKMRLNVLEISREDFELTKKLFEILNIPFYGAPLEAETTCADLCKRGLVDAVMTEDTDVLAYSAPVFLTKTDSSKDTCIRLKHKDILDSLELTALEFTDLCIMLGCDYNDNIPKVGPESSYKHILKYRTIDAIAQNTKLDVSILNYKRSRELFLQYKEIELESIPYCGAPDFERLKEFISEHNIHLSVDNLRKNFVHDVIFVCDDNVEEDDDVIFEIEE